GFREFVRNDTNVAPTAPLTVHDVVPLIPQAVQNELHGTLSTPIDEKEEDDAEWEPDPNCSPDQA
ncbi:MAG: hypothetical protein M1823_001721, partial [Watsoniomyces obsoletus]